MAVRDPSLNGPPPAAAAAQAAPADVWKRPERLGYHETLRGLGGVVAPLLAGFSLATIGVLVSASDAPPLAGWTTAALAAAVGLLLLSMQCAFLALARNPSPAEILAWHPEVAVDATTLEDARAAQRATFADMARFWKISGAAYDFGVLAFLVGVVLMLAPEHWSVARGVAFGIGCLTFLGELWWALANRTSLPHPVVRDETVVEQAPATGAVGRAAVLDEARRAAAGI